jgi:hypothetical protein
VTDNTIIRAPRRRRFVVVDHTVVDDERLTLAARGLLVLLLSRPDDWQIRVSDLRKRCHAGRDAIYKLLRELRKLGYIRYVPNRTASGRLAGGTYYVHEIPAEIPSATPLPVLPEAVAPDTREPDALPNIQKNLTTTTTNYVGSGNGEAAGSSETLIFPDGLLAAERNEAARLVTELLPVLRQQVLDELAGLMKAGKIREVPLACLAGIVAKAKEGAFRPYRALRIAQAREERRRAEAVLERARAKMPTFPARSRR